MPIRMLTARERDIDYHFRVWADTSKTISVRDQDNPGLDDAPNMITVPDPAYVDEFTWSRVVPPGLTRAQYLASIRSEVRALVQQRRPVTAVAGSPITGLAEGTDL